MADDPGFASLGHPVLDERASYLRRAGAAFRRVINDLKRNEEAAAQELGIDPRIVREIIAGSRPLDPALRARATQVWPVNERDFLPFQDDAPAGVRIMRARESASTSRVFQRGGVDYYEYRDTAMSRVCPIRPEWIRMLQVACDNDPENELVRWNNGHFLFQFTYFVGPVNYYYQWNQRKLCAPMTTGDSVFGVPFAPHSFTARSRNTQALILALTFGGRIGADAQHELAILGDGVAEKLALPAGDEKAAQSARLRLHLENGAYSIEYLSAATGIEQSELEQVLAGGRGVDPRELDALARAFDVPLRELVPTLPDTTAGVVLTRSAEARTWFLPAEASPAYRLKRLAGSRITPFTRSLEIEVLQSASSVAPYRLEAGLHQYGYQLGPEAVVLRWHHAGRWYDTTLEPDDSFYMKPFVPHCFLRPSSGKGPGIAAPPRVLILRVGGHLVGDAGVEASLIGAGAIRRATSDATQWYDP